MEFHPSVIAASHVIARPWNTGVTLPIACTNHSELISIIYGNQRSWVCRVGAIGSDGAARDLFERDGMLAAPTGTTGAIMLPTDTRTDLAALDEAIESLRRVGSANVLVWAAEPNPDVDIFLLANGAQESFAPRWMARPIAVSLPEAPAGPATVAPVRAGDIPSLLNATEIPYHSAWQVTASARLAMQELPDAVTLMVARIGGEIVGRGVLNLAQSPLGTTAGVYDVGVAPTWQRQGIGRQVIHALMTTAREHGADLLTLNATPAGEPLYRAFGFEDAGEGQTWLLPTAILRHPPREEHVRFAMRIARGEPLTGMSPLALRLLSNRETPLALAARFGQVETARELLAMGTMPDVAALWELGLEEEALATMRAHPRSLNVRYGAKQVTPLHLAIFWNDLDFLAALLKHGADPSVRDGELDSDAVGWAHALGNDEALDILDMHLPARLA